MIQSQIGQLGLQAFLKMVIWDNFIHADLHPGNILVSVSNGRASPVLLDFGMTVRLSDEQRLGYARLAFAVQQMDVAGMQAAVRSLGVLTNQTSTDAARDLERLHPHPRHLPHAPAARVEHHEHASGRHERVRPAQAPRPQKPALGEALVERHFLEGKLPSFFSDLLNNPFHSGAMLLLTGRLIWEGFSGAEFILQLRPFGHELVELYLNASRLSDVFGDLAV